MRLAAFFAIVALFVVGLTTTRISMPANAAECDANYTGPCVSTEIEDITCDDLGEPAKVVGVDVYNLDTDKNGTACDEADTEGSGRAKKACGTVFVGGKGIVDSCSTAHKDTSRVYPRKPGVPANGCAKECPEATEATTTKPATAGTQGPADKSTPRAGGPSAFATPVPSDFTAPPEFAATPTPAPTNCDRVSYPDVCVPQAPPYLSCSDIPDRNFRVRAPDPHRFDADGNGIGCEQVAGPSIGR